MFKPSKIKSLLDQKRAAKQQQDGGQPLQDGGDQLTTPQSANSDSLANFTPTSVERDQQHPQTQPSGDDDSASITLNNNNNAPPSHGGGGISQHQTYLSSANLDSNNKNNGPIILSKDHNNSQNSDSRFISPPPSSRKSVRFNEGENVSVEIQPREEENHQEGGDRATDFQEQNLRGHENENDEDDDEENQEAEIMNSVSDLKMPHHQHGEEQQEEERLNNGETPAESFQSDENELSAAIEEEKLQASLKESTQPGVDNDVGNNNNENLRQQQLQDTLELTENVEIVEASPELLERLEGSTKSNRNNANNNSSKQASTITTSNSNDEQDEEQQRHVDPAKSQNARSPIAGNPKMMIDKQSLNDEERGHFDQKSSLYDDLQNASPSSGGGGSPSNNNTQLNGNSTPRTPNSSSILNLRRATRRKIMMEQQNSSASPQNDDDDDQQQQQQKTKQQQQQQQQQFGEEEQDDDDDARYCNDMVTQTSARGSRRNSPTINFKNSNNSPSNSVSMDVYKQVWFGNNNNNRNQQQQQQQQEIRFETVIQKHQCDKCGHVLEIPVQVLANQNQQQNGQVEDDEQEHTEQELQEQEQDQQRFHHQEHQHQHQHQQNRRRSEEDDGIFVEPVERVDVEKLMLNERRQQALAKATQEPHNARGMKTGGISTQQKRETFSFLSIPTASTQARRNAALQSMQERLKQISKDLKVKEQQHRQHHEQILSSTSGSNTNTNNQSIPRVSAASTSPQGNNNTAAIVAALPKRTVSPPLHGATTPTPFSPQPSRPAASATTTTIHKPLTNYQKAILASMQVGLGAQKLSISPSSKQTPAKTPVATAAFGRARTAPSTSPQSTTAKRTTTPTASSSSPQHQQRSEPAPAKKPVGVLTQKDHIEMLLLSRSGSAPIAKTAAAIGGGKPGTTNIKDNPLFPTSQNGFASRAPIAEKHCGQCSTAFESGARFCGVCGKKREWLRKA